MAWEAAVGGGAVPVADTVGGVDTILITAETLPIGSLAAQVGCATAGAIATFIGTTRNTFEGKRVLRLEYEAYEPMAKKEMLAICAEMRTRWPLRHIAMAHRTGVVPVGESSVEIAVSSAHRREGLEAVHYAIDELKARVPIWKREVYEGDERAWKQNKEWQHPEASRQDATDTSR